MSRLDHDFDDDCWHDADEPSALQEQLAATPWWVISASVHLFVICVILPVIQCAAPRTIPPIVIKTSLETLPEEELEETITPEKPTKVKSELPPVEDAITDEISPDLENETPDDAETEDAKGDPNHISDAQLDQRFTESAIGPGGGAGGQYGHRTGGKRKRVKSGGGDPRAVPRMELGLRWLADHQDEDGKWDADGFMKHDEPSDPCTGPAALGWVDPGVTGLALMAFLGAGHTHRFSDNPRYKDVVKRTLRYLMRIQDSKGLYGGKRGHYMYNHAICSLAMCEAYAMTRSPLLRGSVTKAVQYLIDARNEGMAWRYYHQSGDNDVSVTGWVVMALKSARAAKVKVTGLDGAFADAERYIEAMTSSDYYITGYKNRPPRGWQGPTSSRFVNEELGIDNSVSHGGTHSMTAIATMCRVFFGYKRNDKRLRGGASVVAGSPPSFDKGGAGKLSKIDHYYWYYGTLAMFQMGGEYWKAWKKGMEPALINTQCMSGSARGSWDPEGAWGGLGGRVYSTAINTLSLQIYFRYARVFR